MGNVYSEIGFKCVTAAQLTNLIVLMRRAELTAFDARVYLGAVELASRREVARRIRQKRRSKIEKLSRYSLNELLALIQNTSFLKLKRALKKLSGLGLLTFSTEQITFETSLLFPHHELVGELEKRGALSRLVPIPRRFLVELCREKKKSLFLTKLAYVVRGLSLERKTGTLRSRGTIKASWIANHFGLSIRAVRLARRALIECQLISKDTSSFQRKLNRDGAYFEMNLSRYAGTLRVVKECKTKDLSIVPAHCAKDSAGILEGVTPVEVDGAFETPKCFHSHESRIAPPVAKKQPHFAPLREKQETPNGSKNQKPAQRAESGVCAANGEGKPVKPDLRNIQLQDLQRLSRLQALYGQAIAANWLAHSEANFQRFIGAAVRATRIKGNAVRVFVTIVKGKLWHHITQEQEDRARVVLRRYRERTSLVVSTTPETSGVASISEIVAQLSTSICERQELKLTS